MTKTIYITGGGRGIGRATAIACGARGWNVAINYRSDDDAANETVQSVEKAGGKATAIKADVSTEKGVILFFDEADEVFNEADGVVNNAGIVYGGQPFTEITLERIEKLFQVNAVGAVLVAREAARRLKSGGSLVNISSMAAKLGAPNEYVDYAATKGAVDTMTIGLSKELGPKGIRVNAIRPGVIKTAMNLGPHDPDRAYRVGKTSPLGRPGEADEVSGAIVYLLSDEATYTTGAIIDVAGGR